MGTVAHNLCYILIAIILTPNSGRNTGADTGGQPAAYVAGRPALSGRDLPLRTPTP
jgi:hypothetical protein